MHNQETAINIAYSCNLLSDDMKHIVVIEGSSEAEVEVSSNRDYFDRIVSVRNNQLVLTKRIRLKKFLDRDKMIL